MQATKQLGVAGNNMLLARNIIDCGIIPKPRYIFTEKNQYNGCIIVTVLDIIFNMKILTVGTQMTADNPLTHEVDVWKYVTEEYDPPKYILGVGSYYKTIRYQIIATLIMYVCLIIVSIIPSLNLFIINTSFMLLMLAVVYANKRKFLKSYNEALFILSLKGINTKYFEYMIENELKHRECIASVS